ncbi:MAG: zinc-binding dehydrogenase [Lachnospirales bacterium]
MKAVAYLKPGVDFVDVPDAQEPKDYMDWVKIKTAYCGICGTDAHIVGGHFDGLIPDGVAFPVGHEVSGTILELGPKATSKGLKVGDKVAFYFNYHCGKCHYCRTGKENMCLNIEANLSVMTDFFYAHEQQVYKLPESIDLLEGAMTEPVSFALRVVECGNVVPGETALISGGGAIGLISMQLLKHAGASKITVVEPVEAKRKLALELGAHYVIDPMNEDVQARIDEITNGLGYDSVYECSGAIPTIQSMLEYVARCGTVVYVAMYGFEQCANVNLWTLFDKEIKVTAPHQSPYTWERAINILPDLNLEVFTKSVFKKEDCVAAFEEQKTSKQTKVMIDLR